MAAYAALVSLMRIIDQIQFHPRPPVSLDKTQVESLTKIIMFLQEFLEGYSHISYTKEADVLESRIVDAAYAAEDIIESHIVDQILAASTSHGETICSTDFYERLQEVIAELDSIRKEVLEIKQKTGVQDQLHITSTPAGSSRYSTTGQKSNMVGFDDVLLEIMDKLTGERVDRQIISIVGMGGIGKTTLAKNIFQHNVVVQHFDILAWITISQEYSMKETLLELLQEGGGNLSHMDEYELGDKLHKRLLGRRYLIILDDVWNIEVWDQLKFYFPNNNNGSSIMLTTRLSNLASQVANSHCIEMDFLDKDNSWNLFSSIVFGEESCPPKLKEIGKKIVKNCRGLPLSIVVIGGLLAKSKHTREYWKYIEENLNPVVNSEDNERCLKILNLSYNQLPIYLKPCFLYMGVFPEDRAIRVSMLIELWIAEGFLKSVSGKSLEEIAEDYLKELVNRNLILVHELVSTGNIKYCSIHDLLRDLCLREAEEKRFYHVTGQPRIPQGIMTQRRIVIPQRLSQAAVDASQSRFLARSLICCNILRGNFWGFPWFNFGCLRILKSFTRADSFDLEDMFKLINLRYFAATVYLNSNFPSSVRLLWNLHTLIVDNGPTCTAPVEIWNMPQLRHVRFRNLYLQDPPCHNGEDNIVLENLHTLVRIREFKCSEEVVKRIPNIKKLKTYYEEHDGISHYYAKNLDRLHKLESFGCRFYPRVTGMISRTNFLHNITFPHSLKKLTFAASHVYWEDTLVKIGSLPLLE